MSYIPRWKLRFTAPQIGFPAWSSRAPGLLAFVSNESGSWQGWALDLESGRRRRLTDEPIGVEQVLVAPDGRIVWWQDLVGNERGRWMARAFEGDEPHPLVPGIPEGWPMGISFAGDVIALAVSTDADYQAYLVPPTASPVLLHASDGPVGVGRLDPMGAGGLSADGLLVCVRHTEHGDILHHALRVHGADGRVIDELVDERSNLDPVAWSPMVGDSRLVFTSELGAFERPAIWDPTTGERRDLVVDLPGAVIPIGWWPDATALLVRHEHHGRDQLYRLDPETEETSLFADTGGEIAEAAVRPDGEVWLLTSESRHQPRVLTADGDVIVDPPREPAPAGRPFHPLWFENLHGQRVQGSRSPRRGTDRGRRS